MNALLQGLTWAGYTSGVAGLNVLPTSFAGDSVTQLRTDARNYLKTVGVDVLVAAGGTVAANVAENINAEAPATTTPVVFTSVNYSLSHSPSNMTGIFARTTEFDVDKLKLLKELRPDATSFGLLYNFGRNDKPHQLARLTNQASILGVSLDPKPIDLSLAANFRTQVGQAFQAWATGTRDGAIVAADPLFHNRRDIIINAAAGNINIAGVAHAIRPIPAIYQWREFTENGGLLSYGPNLTVAYQLAGTYVGRVLDKIAASAGGGPAVDLTDMPVLPLDNCEEVVNLTTARALDTAYAASGGFKIPPWLLVRAELDRFLKLAPTVSGYGPGKLTYLQEEESDERHAVYCRRCFSECLGAKRSGTVLSVTR